MAGHSTQATHLTSLDLDISGVKKSLQEVDEAVQQTAQKVRASMNDALNGMGGADSGGAVGGGASRFNSTVSAIESLNLAYKNFLNTLSKTKLTDTALGQIPAEAQKAATDMEALAAAVKGGVKPTQEQSKQYKELQSRLKELKGNLKDAETEANKTGNGFKDLGDKAENAGNGVADFLNKLSDKVKWMAAYQIVNMIQNAFSQVISTIKDTEDAVVDLQRVLNDDTLSDSAISSELYDIAYEFGQSFENVQEVALRFAQTGKTWQETINATRATMLGLNTAELEVTTATEGLIAVMAQFDIEAEDLEKIIDKINITADNFPVTSEKIVAALQRAGGTASAFNMTLEETIATITALAEKTGRSGANIGTALNSLIIFTSKSDNLKLFSSLSDQMDAVVKKFQSGSASVIEVWQQLSTEIEKLSGEQQEALFNSTAYEEFADEFEAQAAEYAAAIQEIYGTAGAYRRNYLTVLLQDIGTVDEALATMAQSEGYSLSENEKYMATLTAQWNQLVIAAKELAVQFGEAGFLDALKIIVNITTEVLKLTNTLGGLRTILIALAGALASAKIGKIQQQISDANTWIGKLSANIKAAGGAAKYAATSFKAWATTTAGAIGIVTGLITVISAAVSAYKAYREAQAEARQETIALGEAAKKQSEDIAELYQNVLNTTDTDQTGAISSLMASSKISEKDIKKHIELRRQEQGVILSTADALKELLDIQLQEQAVEVEKGAEASIAALKDQTDLYDGLYYAQTLLDNAGRKVMESADPEEWNRYQTIMSEFNNTISKIPSNISEVSAQIRILKTTMREAEDMGTLTDESRTAFEESIAYLENLRDSYNKSIAQAKLMKSGIENYTKALERQKEEQEALAEVIQEELGVTKDVADSMAELVSEMKQFDEAISDIASNISTMEKSYKSIIDVVDEYNKTGVMTGKMLETLLELEPEYLELLEFEGGQLGINQEKVDGLNDAYSEQLKQLAALQLAKEIDRTITDLQAAADAGLTLEEYRAQQGAAALYGETYRLAYEFITGKMNATQFSYALGEVGRQAGLAEGQIESLRSSIVGLGSAMGATFGLKFAPSFGGSSYSGGGGYGGGGGRAKTAKEQLEEQAQELKDAFDDMVDGWEHSIYLLEKNNAPVDNIVEIYRKMRTATEQQANKYRAMGLDENSKFLRNLQKNWWSYTEKIAEALHDVYEKSVKEHENTLKLLQNYYDIYVENIDKVSMQDNLQKQLSVNRQIMAESIEEIRRLQNTGVKLNDEAVQKCIDKYYDAYEEFRDINSKISDNILNVYDSFISLADSFDVWDRIDFTKSSYLEKKLRDINQLYTQGTITLREYKELLEDTGLDYYKAREEELNKQAEDEKAYYDDIIAGYREQIKELERLRDESNDYYDGLIENLRQVQEDNDRINEQLDYYTNRQKIITNLEQAQSRSGIEWREKEMEYQQQLIDLDEDWRRTQEGWSIEDQITILEKLKEEAAAQFEESIKQLEAYIEAVQKQSEEALEAISIQIDELRYKIYNAIREAIDGLSGGLDNVFVDMLGNINNSLLIELEPIPSEVGATADQAGDAWANGFTNPVIAGINSISNAITGGLVQAGQQSARQLYNVYERNFIAPLKGAIGGIMAGAIGTSSQSVHGVVTPGVDVRGKVNGQYVVNNTANMYANVTSSNVASGAFKGLAAGFMTNPRRT